MRLLQNASHPRNSNCDIAEICKHKTEMKRAPEPSYQSHTLKKNAFSTSELFKLF